MRVVLIEDERALADAYAAGLRAAGFETRVAHDGLMGLGLALTEWCEAVVLDLQVPGLAGDGVLAALRQSRPDVPVVIVTARGAVHDRVQLLEAGADDYLVKPVAMAELVARLRLRAKRRLSVSPDSSSGSSKQVLQIGDLQLDRIKHEVTVASRRIDLSAREFALLDVLASSPGRVWSKQQLLDRVWDGIAAPGSNVVEQYVKHVRRKIGQHRIETVRGVGYRIPL